eukprot:g3536.t1
MSGPVDGLGGLGVADPPPDAAGADGPEGPGVAQDAHGEAAGEAGAQDNQIPLDEQGFPTVADPDGDDPDNAVAPKSLVVKLARKIPTPADFPRNPYALETDTARHVKFYCENLPMIGIEGTMDDFDRQLFSIEAALIRIGFDVHNPGCKFQLDARDDKAPLMGKYEKRISDKRLTLQKIADSLRQANALIIRDKEISELEGNTNRQQEMMKQLQKKLEDAAEREANPPAMRSCLVCMKKVPELLDTDKETRCTSCKSRGVCTDCWKDRSSDVAKFFPDQNRPKLCFSCVSAKQTEEMELYCEEVQSACGTIQTQDAKQIVLEQPWFWKLSQARSEKPDAVLDACDLIRYPRMARLLRKADDTAFQNLATAASAMQKSSHALIAGTMDRKIIASTYQHIGFKTLFGTSKKGAPDANAHSVNLDSIEQFFRELADGYSKHAPLDTQTKGDKDQYQIAAYLCQEALFMIKCARDDYLGRTYLSFSELSAGDRVQLEQMIRCSVYVAMREDRKSLKKGSLLTKTERVLYQAKYANRIRQLELRAVQKLIVAGSFGGNGGADMKNMEKRLSSLQSTTDKLQNKIGAGGVRASLGDQGGGGDPNNPTNGNVANWDYGVVSKLPAYIELKQNIQELSPEEKKEARKEWCSSTIRTSPKMVMFTFDTYRGRHMPGCRNCWAEKGGGPPMHAYTACRSLRNPYYLICPHCSREHPEWPEACAAAPTRKSDGNGGGGDGRGGGGKRGSQNNNKKKGQRNAPYSKGGGGNQGGASSSRGEW